MHMYWQLSEMTALSKTPYLPHQSHLDAKAVREGNHRPLHLHLNSSPLQQNGTVLCQAKGSPNPCNPNPCTQP